MIQIIFSQVSRAVSLVQQSISVIIANWWFFLTASILGFTLEESFHGFHIIKLLGLL
jgi:hypothetical protein